MTKIEWATHTSNWLAGCTKVSPACAHCYAETMSARLATMPQAPQRYRDGVVEGRRWTGEVSYDPAALAAAFNDLRSAKHPRRVFINSMSDTFHEVVPSASLAELATYILQHDVIRAARRRVRRGEASGVDHINAGLMHRDDHVIMLLTKRPGRLLSWQRERFPGGLPSWVWVGCTVEDQRRADERVPVLLQVQTAGVRFLSVEPLLGPVDLSAWICVVDHCVECRAENLPQEDDRCPECGALGALIRTATGGECERYRSGQRYDDTDPTGGADVAGQPTDAIGWVIAGCESGAGRRETSVEWVRALRDDCAAAGVPFFLKQLYVDGQKVGLPELDGKVHAAVPGAS
jgi:protein gp37